MNFSGKITPPPQQNRELYIDYTRALAMLLVIVGHINSYNSFIKNWAYSFHMPLFFILSGMLFKAKQQFDFKNTTLNSIKYLYVPYAIWALIYADFSIKNIFCVLYGSYESLLSANSNTNLWFFPAFILARIIAEATIFALRKIKNGRIMITAQVISACALLVIGISLPKLNTGWPFNLNNAMIGSTFMILGVIIKRLSDRTDKHLTLTIIIGTLSFFGSFTYKVNNIPNGYVHMGKGYYGNLLLFLVGGILGSLFLLSIGKFLSKILNPSRVLSKAIQFIGCNTFIILAVQLPIISISEFLCRKLAFNGIFALVVPAAFTTVLCCVAALLCNFTAPYLGGKKLITK